jgi:hypothetical protein
LKLLGKQLQAVASMHPAVRALASDDEEVKTMAAAEYLRPGTAHGRRYSASTSRSPLSRRMQVSAGGFSTGGVGLQISQIRSIPGPHSPANRRE